MAAKSTGGGPKITRGLSLMWLLIAFLAVPLIEIGLFIQVGGAIGLFPTLGVVILTAVAGTYLVRSQGGQALARLRGSMETLEDPSGPLADGAMILIAGALLLTPGFFTDAVGFALLIPQSRAVILRFLKSRIKVQSFQMGPGPGPGQSRPRHPQGGPAGSDVIDGEYEEVRTDAPRVAPGPKRPSGWTQH